eukprot:6188772-Alexandrium_andersonii.AAC.1
MPRVPPGASPSPVAFRWPVPARRRAQSRPRQTRRPAQQERPRGHGRQPRQPAAASGSPRAPP